MSDFSKVTFPAWYAKTQPVDQWEKELEFEGNRYVLNCNEVKVMPTEVATAFVTAYANATIIGKY